MDEVPDWSKIVKYLQLALMLQTTSLSHLYDITKKNSSLGFIHGQLKSHFKGGSQGVKR